MLVNVHGIGLRNKPSYVHMMFAGADCHGHRELRPNLVYRHASNVNAMPFFHRLTYDG